MLLPKRVKYRRVHRGRLTGKAMRGNKVTYGEYGLVALEPSWITSNQIEAARIAKSLTSARPESCKAARGMTIVLLLGSWFKLNFMLFSSLVDILGYGLASAPIRPTARRRGSSGWSCRDGDRSW